MAKVSITDPEELREPTLPGGTYRATITKCYVNQGNWRGVPNVERVIAVYTLAPHDEVEFAAGRVITQTMPILRGESNDFLKFCSGMKVHPADFDSEDVLNEEVDVDIISYIRKTGPNAGEPANMVQVARLANSSDDDED